MQLFKSKKESDIKPQEKTELVNREVNVKEPEKRYDFILKEGDENRKVKQLQYALGGVVIDGRFGNNTKQRILSRVNTTGDINSQEFDRIISGLEDKPHIKLARSYVGQIEEQDVTGDGVPDNRSPEIDKMTKYVFPWYNPDEDDKGYAWCAIFISYVLHTAYNDFTFKDASVAKWVKWFKETDDILEIQNTQYLTKGSIYIGAWVNSNGLGHIFFVDPYKTCLENDPKLIVTIEGNTNDGGSREGTGVFERERWFTDDGKIKVFGIRT